MGSVFVAMPVVGQSVPPLQDRPDRPIDITVQYSISLPVKSGDVEAQRAALEQGRRMLYEMASAECEVLLATISVQCRMERLNVQSNPARRQNEDLINLTANGQYKITVKPKQ